eukprot:TRINITY_DN8702_c0_g1_i1.p1 TRINITY_DN8702_c0_g1~~TRINITY_DN8702_c0_g1_i1.p1  ORF type:complete len:114 (-),score=31.20 TRINITY_DN8702_c0_g1_i1:41-382(-)
MNDILGNHEHLPMASNSTAPIHSTLATETDPSRFTDITRHHRQEVDKSAPFVNAPVFGEKDRKDDRILNASAKGINLDHKKSGIWYGAWDRMYDKLSNLSARRYNKGNRDSSH